MWLYSFINIIRKELIYMWDERDEKNEKDQETMESIDVDAFRRMLEGEEPRRPSFGGSSGEMQSISSVEPEKPQAERPAQTEKMDSIDVEEFRKMLEEGPSVEEELEAYTPIEVKSTQHIERQKQEEQKKENVVSAHQAANEVFDWLESILMAVIAIVLIFTFILRVNTVSGESMLPTLIDGQKLVVTDLFYTPNYNDVVIIQAANLDSGIPIVKRIIGLPGDKINIDFENGVVYRNGQPLAIEIKDGLIYEDGHTINTYTTRNLEMVSGQDYFVPEDYYFVLGDNRNNSKDSRLFSEIGFVNKNYIAGHAIFSIFPFDTFGAV